MADLHERDAMTCRACGKEERASEGYPCGDCGRFVCNMCNMRGIVLCAACSPRAAATSAQAHVPGA
jgi:hypothetical protein